MVWLNPKSRFKVIPEFIASQLILIPRSVGRENDARMNFRNHKSVDGRFFDTGRRFIFRVARGTLRERRAGREERL